MLIGQHGNGGLSLSSERAPDGVPKQFLPVRAIEDDIGFFHLVPSLAWLFNSSCNSDSWHSGHTEYPMP